MARGRRSPFTIILAPAERAQLEYWQRSTTILAGLAKRAHIVLWRAEGLALSEIARLVGLGRRIVRKWLQRFINQRIPRLSDKPGRGRRPVFSPRRGGPSCQAGLRATGYARPLPLTVGLPGTGAPTGTRGRGGADLAGDRAPHSEAPQASAVVPSYVALTAYTKGCGVLCPRRRGGRSVCTRPLGRRDGPLAG